MKKTLLTLFALMLIFSMVLSACAPKATATKAPEAQPEATKAPEPTAPPAKEGKVQVRWFVGLGTGTDPAQQEVQSQVVAEFNASQDKILLIIEVVPYNSARDALSTQIASGAGPDIVGPVGWGGSNDFYGQWLDLAPLVESSGFDTTQFNPALVDMYQTEEGMVGLPFMVFPAAVYYRPELFDEAGLNYPPAKYGDKYTMPDGSQVDWSWETMAEVGKLLTIDINGKNATEDGFDATQISQYGYVPQWQNGRHMTGFYGGQEMYVDGKSVINDAARAAWQNYYDGMWGAQPWIPTAAWAASPDNGSGNNFNGGKVAMGITHAWYMCCVGDLVTAGSTFQFGTLPSFNGKVNGRVDADTYRILKTSEHPEEAFEVMTYLITTAAVKLSTVYGGLPARDGDQVAWLTAKQEQFPFVTTWDTLMAGLAYADVPSAEGYLPNGIEANTVIATFIDKIGNNAGLDLNAEIDQLEKDLQVVYDKKQ
jgi:multiple sugar transport system substrate-binding protein